MAPLPMADQQHSAGQRTSLQPESRNPRRITAENPTAKHRMKPSGKYNPTDRWPTMKAYQ